DELKTQLGAPRAFWMMVPAGDITEGVFQDLLKLADRGDTIVDGGNSNFRDSQRRYREAQERGLHFVDAEPVHRLEPIFTALAPEEGYAHVGASGAGHFTKMVHNGIEYGLMQAYV